METLAFTWMGFILMIGLVFSSYLLGWGNLGVSLGFVIFEICLIVDILRNDWRDGRQSKESVAPPKSDCIVQNGAIHINPASSKIVDSNKEDK